MIGLRRDKRQALGIGIACSGWGELERRGSQRRHLTFGWFYDILLAQQSLIV